jgi:hypothetical protein
MSTDCWNTNVRLLEQARTPRAARFQPLDPDILSAAIPTFFIGRDRDGFWLIRDAKGENGGIFLLKSSALAFARKLAGPLGCATVLSPERFELDMENRGNPLIDYLKPLLHFAAAARRWITNH